MQKTLAACCPHHCNVWVHIGTIPNLFQFEQYLWCDWQTNVDWLVSSRTL